jgi:hypothetical protein
VGGYDQSQQPLNEAPDTRPHPTSRWPCVASAAPETHTSLNCRWTCMARATEMHTPSTADGRAWPEQSHKMHTPCQLQLDVYGQSSSLKCTPPLNCRWTCMARATEVHTPSTADGRAWPEQSHTMHTPCQLQLDVYGQSSSLKCTPLLNCKWTCMARATEMHTPWTADGRAWPG